MKIKFEIQNPENTPSGVKHCAVFGASGGSVGAGDPCDWVVQNLNGKIPEILATITYDGQRFLMDVAGQCIRVNGASRPLSAGRRFVLCDGDTVRFDDLSLAVRVGSQAYLDHRVITLETLVTQDSDSLENLLLQTASSVLKSTDSEAHLDPIELLDSTLESSQGTDPLALWGSQADRKAGKSDNPLLSVLSYPSTALTSTLDAVSRGGFDPVSAPTIRKDIHGFEELASCEANILPAVLDPGTIERHVAYYCDPSDADFTTQCWAQFRYRLAELKTSGD